MSFLLLNHLVALVLIVLTSFTLSIFILAKNRQLHTNKIFAVYMAAVGWWTLWEFFSMFSPNERVASLLERVEYLGVCFIPTLFYHGVINLVELQKQRRTELTIYYLASGIFFIFITILGHPAFLPNAAPVAYLPYWGHAGPLFFTFTFFFSGVVVRSLQTLLAASTQIKSPMKQAHVRWVFWASAIAYFGGTPELALKHGFYTPILNPFGLYLIPLHIIAIFYAIIQFRLFDINIVIRRSLIYSFLVTLLTAGYFGLVYAIEGLFRQTFGYQSSWLSLIAFALMVLLFQPLKIGIQRVVDLIIFRAPQEELARRLERFEEEAHASEKQKAIATLAAGMAHEIKNPLTALKTYAEFIPLKGDDPAFRQKLHDVLAHETRRIQDIVQDLLEFSKPKEPHFKTVDPKELIDSTIQLLSSELDKKRILYSTSYAHNGATIQADPDQIRQVLINLIQNAADAMPTGGKLGIVSEVKNGYLELRVSDTGSGIPKELLPQIFEPFVTTKPKGTGLGLSMVRSLIQAHHGSIEVRSIPGVGTSFEMRLPL